MREKKALDLIRIHVAGCLTCYRAGGERAFKELLCKTGKALKVLLELSRKKYEWEETNDAA